MGAGSQGAGGDSGAPPGRAGSSWRQGPSSGRPHVLGWRVAWDKREFLALPVTGAGMTAMWVTPGLGTWVLNSTVADGQTGRQAHGQRASRGAGLPPAMAREARPAVPRGRKGWVFLACVSVVTSRRWAASRRPALRSPTPCPTSLPTPATEVSFQVNRYLSGWVTARAAVRGGSPVPSSCQNWLNEFGWRLPPSANLGVREGAGVLLVVPRCARPASLSACWGWGVAMG